MLTSVLEFTDRCAWRAVATTYTELGRGAAARAGVA
jgi:hypothetical protein